MTRDEQAWDEGFEDALYVSDAVVDALDRIQDLANQAAVAELEQRKLAATYQQRHRSVALLAMFEALTIALLLAFFWWRS
jgi:nitrogen fixation/metabolism regulation signal transduction histidine kinase